MNKNKLAVELSKMEGKKTGVNIAQIKELLKCLKELIKSDARWIGVLLK